MASAVSIGRRGAPPNNKNNSSPLAGTFFIPGTVSLCGLSGSFGGVCSRGNGPICGCIGPIFGSVGALTFSGVSVCGAGARQTLVDPFVSLGVFNMR